MARRRIGIAAVLLAAAALEAGPAVGSTDTGTLTVTATVNSNCSLSGGTLAFGTYTAGQTSNLDAQGAINYVNCPPVISSSSSTTAPTRTAANAG